MSLESQIKKTLMPGMYIPDELSKLFTWIEKNELYVDRDGNRIGMLYPLEQLQAEWGDTERKGGTYVEFFAEGNEDLHYWFGHNKPEVIDRLCVFGKSGMEGSMFAFWLDDSGNQQIVHLGSGSGSTLVCILADTPVDFLRLLAIGYDEICWNEQFSVLPNADAEEAGMFVHPNLEYQAWVKSTFDVSIPERAIEVVKSPSEMGDKNSKDPFCQWVESNT
jgi:hypothetical protein